MASSMERVAGQRFYKMSGSGNDFVFLDGRLGSVPGLETPAVISRVCARGTGVGADGVVVLDFPPDGTGDIVLRYYNADGSRASLCGNATLCTAALAVQLEAVPAEGFTIVTDAGPVRARVRDGLPEFDFPPVGDALADYTPIQRTEAELRLGYATAGVPHVVIRVPDVSACDVEGRGRLVRFDRSLVAGANVNFVAPAPVTEDPGAASRPRWQIRTYERGVEGETLACGTGSVATAILLRMWGDADGDVELETRSGRTLIVRAESDGSASWYATLRGEGRLVYTGELGEL